MMDKLSRMRNFESRSISAENFTGEKGKGGMATEGTGAVAARELGQGWKVSPSISIKAGEEFELAKISGEGSVKHIWMTVGDKNPRTLILRIYWDGSEIPSVEVPVCDFFACADPRRYEKPLSSLAVCVNPNTGYNCYWDMPFYKECRITVENIHTDNIILYYQIDYVLGKQEEKRGYFHAQFRRVNPLPYKEVYTLLDNVQGSGHYVGTYMYWGLNNNGWWGEGEIKFYLDGDKEFPTICGTGTEDYFGGAWNFDVNGQYQDFSSPYSGIKVDKPDGLYRANQRFSMYRWHITDPIYFKENIKVTIQALGWRRDFGKYLPLKDDISSVSFWYQDSICKTFPKLPTADDLEII